MPSKKHKRSISDTPGVYNGPTGWDYAMAADSADIFTPEYIRLSREVNAAQQAARQAWLQQQHDEVEFNKTVARNWYKIGLAPAMIGIIGNTVRNIYRNATHQSLMSKKAQEFRDARQRRDDYPYKYKTK